MQVILADLSSTLNAISKHVAREKQKRTSVSAQVDSKKAFGAFLLSFLQARTSENASESLF